MESVRVDKWLWAARMFKTRSQATKACDAGHVSIDGAGAKASRPVKPGVTVNVLAPGGRRILFVLALGDKRGPASVAQTLYEDRTPPEGTGKPSKRDRRALRRFKGR